MSSGRIVGIVGPETSREALGLMMAGVPAAEAVSSAGTGTADPAASTTTPDSATTSAEETE